MNEYTNWSSNLSRKNPMGNDSSIGLSSQGDLYSIFSLMADDALRISPLVRFTDSYVEFVAQLKHTMVPNNSSQGNVFFYVYNYYPEVSML